jgi:hypothetical protein
VDLRLEDVDEFPLDVVVRSVVYPSAAGRFGR